MSTIVTRAGKGSALTHNEVDANFNNLNTDKLQSGNTAAALTITTATFGAGTVSAPAITTSGDTNTGIFFPAADTIAFTEGGAEAMRINSSGNVGIGTTTPNIYSGSSFKYLTVSDGSTNSYGILTAAGGSGGGGEIDFGNQTIRHAAIASLNGSILGFYTNGTNSGTGITERMRLDSSGNVGIGTSSPLSKLHVNGDIRADGDVDLIGGAGTPEIRMYQNSGNWAIQNSAGSLLFYDIDVAATRVTVDGSGNLGLGVTPSAWGATYRMQQIGYGAAVGGRTAAAQAYLSANWYQDGTGNKYIYNGFATQYQQDSGVHYWFTAPSGTAGNAIAFTQAMTLDASGNLLVGATATISNAKFYVQGNVAESIARFYNSNATTPLGLTIVYSAAAPNNTGSEFLYCSDTGAARAAIRSNGGLANYSANNVNLSDRREKTNFAPAKSYLDTICAIPVQTFNYIDQSEDDLGLTLGVVAQDVQAVAPELVMESNWGTKDNPKMRLSIYQTDLQYALMKALQELKAEFDAYKATHP